jgi:hypothetical protein
MSVGNSLRHSRVSGSAPPNQPVVVDLYRDALSVKHDVSETAAGQIWASQKNKAAAGQMRSFNVHSMCPPNLDAIERVSKDGRVVKAEFGRAANRAVGLSKGS